MHKIHRDAQTAISAAGVHNAVNSFEDFEAVYNFKNISTIRLLRESNDDLEDYLEREKDFLTMINSTFLIGNQRITVKSLQVMCVAFIDKNLPSSGYRGTVLYDRPQGISRILKLDSDGASALLYANVWEGQADITGRSVAFEPTIHCWADPLIVDSDPTLSAGKTHTAYTKTQSMSVNVAFKGRSLPLISLIKFRSWTSLPKSFKKVRDAILVNQSIPNGRKTREFKTALKAIRDYACGFASVIECAEFLSNTTGMSMVELLGGIKQVLYLKDSLDEWRNISDANERQSQRPIFMSDAYLSCGKLGSPVSCIKVDIRNSLSNMKQKYGNSWHEKPQNMTTIPTNITEGTRSIIQGLEPSFRRVSQEYEGKLLPNSTLWGVVNPFFLSLPYRFNVTFNNSRRTHRELRSQYGKVFNWRINDTIGLRKIGELRSEAFDTLPQAVARILEEDQFATSVCDEIATTTELWLLFLTVLILSLGGVQAIAKTMDKRLLAFIKLTAHWRILRPIHQFTAAFIRLCTPVFLESVLCWAAVLAPIIPLALQTREENKAHSYEAESSRTYSIFNVLPVTRGGREYVSTKLQISSGCEEDSRALALVLLVLSISLFVVLNIKFIRFTLMKVFPSYLKHAFLCVLHVVTCGAVGREESFVSKWSGDELNPNPLLRQGFVPDPPPLPRESHESQAVSFTGPQRRCLPSETGTGSENSQSKSAI